jgi:VWFA-related protein
MRNVTGRSVVAALAIVVAAAAAVRTQQPQSGFTTSTTAVVVDVVVRDAKGAPIVDLKPSDFELLEDDVKQRIAAVELIAPGRTHARTTDGARPASPQTTPAVPASEQGRPSEAPNSPTVMALVFHRLSVDARPLAWRAARTYLDGPGREADYVGVFMIDSSLETLQPYTNDREKIAAAVERAGRTPGSTYVRRAPMESLYGDTNPDTSPTASAESMGRPPNVSGYQPAAQGHRDQLQEAAQRMENFFEEMMRDRNGHAEMAALTALAGSLGALPGRKSMVLFSEGLSVPAAAAATFRGAIDAANRSNVSIYAMDAKGLRVHSEQAVTARNLLAIRGVGDDDPAKAADDNTRKSLTSDLERAEFVLKKDPEASLGTLAKETGGFLINNTNDLGSAFARIDADRRFHYLLTYTSNNVAMDGTWRRIAVQVKRRGAEVRARSGYAAVAAMGTVPVLRFESNALSALAATPRPTQIPLRAASFQFPEADGTTRVALYVQAPGSGIAYFVDDARTAWQTHFTILARILDDTGEMIRKGSQPYRLTGPAKDVHVARQGDVLFYRQPTVEPGRYTIDYAIYDELSGQAGTGTLPLAIAARESGSLVMSDIVLVDHAEAVSPDQKDPRNPLYLDSTLIYPNLGTPIVRSARGSLVFFYTARAGRRPLTGRVELVQNGRAVARRALTVPAADDTGLVRHANELPLDEIGAGPYELRVSLSDGRETVARTAAFVLRP